MLGNFLNAIRCAALYSRAQGFGAKGDFGAALQSLKQLAEARQVKIPSSKVPVEVNILAAQIAIGIRAAPVALEAAEIALCQLDDGVGSYNIFDRRYLIAYVRYIIEYVKSWIYDYDYDYDYNHGAYKEYEAVNIARASGYLRNKFPIPPGRTKR